MTIKGPAALLAALVALCWGISTAAAGAPRYAGMVIDANTGKVLYEASADEPRHPASLTKMMTLYLVFEEMRRGRLNAQSQIPFSARASNAAPSKLGLDAGESIAVIDAVKALITKSANDVAIAVAEHIGGSEAGFVRRMNERAHQLGMTKTTFRNASGLPDPEQYTTARDMLTLALRLNDDFPDQFRLFSLRAFTYRGKTYRTHNTLMHSFEGMDGIKTGYTRDSGFNVVTSVRSKGLHLVGAVFGGSSAASRNSQMRFLLRRGLVDASTEKTRRGRPMLVAEPQPAARTQPAVADKALATAAPSASPAWKTTVAAAPQKTAALVAPQPQPAKPRAPQIAAAPAAPEKRAAVEIVAVKAVPMTPPAKAAPQNEVIAVAVAPERTAKAAYAKPIDPPPAKVAARAPAPTAPPTATETVAAKTNRSAVVPGRRPSTLNTQLAMISDAPANTGPGTGATPKAPAAPARPPSTLNAQASSLSGYSQPRAEPWHVGGPNPEDVAAPAGAYDVEIGVYPTADEADLRLIEAQRRSDVLATSTSLALPAPGSRPLAYRARFTGLDQAAANAACADLRRQSVACRVAAAE